MVIALILGGSPSRYWWENIASKGFHTEFVDRVNKILLEQPNIDHSADILAIP